MKSSNFIEHRIATSVPHHEFSFALICTFLFLEFSFHVAFSGFLRTEYAGKSNAHCAAGVSPHQTKAR
jgi:hypothetical protein